MTGSNLGIEPEDLFRLARIVCDQAEDRGCSVAEAIDQLGRSSRAAARGPVEIDGFVRASKRFRLARNGRFGVALFRDPAWDMLLDLLVAEETGGRLSVSALCLGAGVAPTTALRHLQRLVDTGFVIREGDGQDQRRTFVRLTPLMKAALVEFIADWQDAVMHPASKRETSPGDKAGKAAPRRPDRGDFAHHPVFLS